MMAMQIRFFGDDVKEGDNYDNDAGCDGGNDNDGDDDVVDCNNGGGGDDVVIARMVVDLIFYLRRGRHQPFALLPHPRHTTARKNINTA